MGTLTTVFGHILNIASGQSTKQEQNYGAKQNAGSRIGAADQKSIGSRPSKQGPGSILDLTSQTHLHGVNSLCSLCEHACK